jgi:hypothetical protein
MSATTPYGITCPMCGKFVRLGDVPRGLYQTQESFQESKIVQEWQLERTPCSATPGCKAEILCDREDLILQGVE